MFLGFRSVLGYFTLFKLFSLNRSFGSFESFRFWGCSGRLSTIKGLHSVSQGFQKWYCVWIRLCTTVLVVFLLPLASLVT